MLLLNLPFNYKVNFYCKVSAGVVLTFMYLICSTIARDVGACSAAAAPSRGWFYVDRVTHLLEFVILAKSLRKQHAMSWDMDTKTELKKVLFFLLLALFYSYFCEELRFGLYLILWNISQYNTVYMENCNKSETMNALLINSLTITMESI